MQALSQVLVALAASSLFVFAVTRNLIVSGIAGVISLVFYDLAMAVIHENLSMYVAHFPLCIVFYTAYLVLSVSFTRFSPRLEERPRLPGVAIGIFSVLVLIIIFYVMMYLAPLPSGIKIYHAYMIAFLSAALLIVSLVRDIAKMGLALLACVWFAHTAIPEAFALYMSVLCIVSIFVVGATVYYAYKEYNSRNVDLMVKLRL